MVFLAPSGIESSGLTKIVSRSSLFRMEKGSFPQGLKIGWQSSFCGGGTVSCSAINVQVWFVNFESVFLRKVRS